MQNYVKALNHLYKDYDAMYCNDQEPIGFEWISCDDAQSSIVSFIRRGSTSKNQLLFVCNFTPIDRDGFVVGVPCKGNYTEILNSDAEEFGGQGRVNQPVIKAVEEPWDNKEWSITMHLPPLSVVVFQYDYVEPVKKKKAATKAVSKGRKGTQSNKRTSQKNNESEK